MLVDDDPDDDDYSITEAGSASRSLGLPAYEAVDWARTQSSETSAREVARMPKHDALQTLAFEAVQDNSDLFLGPNLGGFWASILCKKK